MLGKPRRIFPNTWPSDSDVEISILEGSTLPARTVSQAVLRIG